MKRLAPLLLPILFLVFSCSKADKQELSVSGKVSMSGEGSISITAWSDTTEQKIPVEWNAADRTFKATIRVTEPSYYRITFFDRLPVDFILSTSDITIDIDESGTPQVKGSPELEVLEKVGAVRTRFEQSATLAAINQSYQEAATRNDEQAMQVLRSNFEAEFKKVNDTIVNVLRASMPSIAVIEFLNQSSLDADQYAGFYQEVADGFKNEWAGYKLVKDFKARVEKMKATAIGAMAPEISLPDPDGKMVKLSSFRGKYVLVDFWAKWCGPCRQENPNLVKAWNRFRKKNFQVVGVSLDRNKADWVMAIEQDGLDWVHISDLQYFNSVAARDYNINAIPFSVLIDPNGVIVEKNLRGAVLEEKLSKYLDSPVK